MGDDKTRSDRAQATWAKRVLAMLDAEEAAFVAMVARLESRLAASRAKRRVLCGAMTRKGTPCQGKSEPGKRRCKYHGGKSTGARTPEGRERIREAQRRRWDRWRAERAEAGPF